MLLIACEFCDAAFQLKHSMEERIYTIKYCPFCGGEFSQDEKFKDDMEWLEEEKDGGLDES